MLLPLGVDEACPCRRQHQAAEDAELGLEVIGDDPLLKALQGRDGPPDDGALLLAFGDAARLDGADGDCLPDFRDVRDDVSYFQVLHMASPPVLDVQDDLQLAQSALAELHDGFPLADHDRAPVQVVECGPDDDDDDDECGHPVAGLD